MTQTRTLDVPPSTAVPAPHVTPALRGPRSAVDHARRSEREQAMQRVRLFLASVGLSDPSVIEQHAQRILDAATEDADIRDLPLRTLAVEYARSEYEQWTAALLHQSPFRTLDGPHARLQGLMPFRLRRVLRLHSDQYLQTQDLAPQFKVALQDVATGTPMPESAWLTMAPQLCPGRHRLFRPRFYRWVTLRLRQCFVRR